MSLRYMLDADIVSYAIKGHGQVGTRMLDHPPSHLCVSAITLAELRFGADHKGSTRLHRLLDAFVRPLSVLPLDADVAARYGKVAALLRQSGTPIGAFDTLVAAHALVAGLTLVTNNLRHFERVPGLRAESWA
ncbi:MAG TPA: PIN domain-containing protein [Thermoanaerobaculia bacterium]|nr:PIN domain-containing protein [Thermoanaerobaculia bacterium]